MERAREALTRTVRFFNAITIEPAYVLFTLSHGLYTIVAQTLYIDKVCNVNLAFNETICADITHHKDEQNEVQRYVAMLQSCNGVLQAIPAIVFSAFAGPWSDKYGRKPLIVLASFGYVFNNAVFMLNSPGAPMYKLKAEYLLFEVCGQQCLNKKYLHYLCDLPVSPRLHGWICLFFLG